MAMEPPGANILPGLENVLGKIFTINVAWTCLHWGGADSVMVYTEY